MSAESPEKLFQDVSAFISESRTLLEKGAVMELDGLDAEVRRLCDAVLGLSQEQRIVYADKLQVLMKGLSALGDEMAKQRDAVVSEMRGLNQYRKAHVAYSTADATDDFGKKKEDNGNG
ncbi:MAG: hypothetical protein ACK502_06010 [Alphaproteobacteria bacterium]